VSMALNQLGGAGSYMEPLVVKDPDERVSQEEVKRSIMDLMVLEAGVGVLLFLVVVLYFPDRPPVPPSLSSFVEKPAFKLTLKKLLKKEYKGSLKRLDD
ncbi:hypothetical protein SK128_011929, partial [Halocaridina rubra]